MTAPDTNPHPDPQADIEASARADAIACITPFLHELHAAQRSEPADSGRQWCASLEVSGHPAMWVQVLDRSEERR